MRKTGREQALVGADIFAEGWALYSEELMDELGYYTDEERLMQLEWTLVRAARILIDVGLHTRGMTFDHAVTVLTDQVHLERDARPERSEALHDDADAAARRTSSAARRSSRCASVKKSDGGRVHAEALPRRGAVARDHRAGVGGARDVQ